MSCQRRDDRCQDRDYCHPDVCGRLCGTVVRTQNETVTLTHGNREYSVTVGFSQSGDPREVFATDQKSGSAMDWLLADACVSLSLLLQRGGHPREVASRMVRIDGVSPATIFGAISDLLAGMER